MSERADWSEWTEPQLRALLPLWFAVPVHETALRRTHKVAGNTLHSLVKAGLARRIYLFETPGLPIPFVCLTQKGERVRRDYVRWHRSVRAKVGSLPPAMAGIAGARL